MIGGGESKVKKVIYLCVSPYMETLWMLSTIVWIGIDHTKNIYGQNP